MAVTTVRSFSLHSRSPTIHHHHRHSAPLNLKFISQTPKPHRLIVNVNVNNRPIPLTIAYSGGNDGVNGGNGGGGGGGGGEGDDGDDAGEKNKAEAFLVLAEAGRSLESIPKDIAASIDAGKLPGSIVKRYLELEKSAVFRWLLQFGGFKERLLADDLFLTKVGIECGVGIFTKSAAELEKRRENFSKELDFVFADVVMAIIADFMLVWLPAPTVSLRGPIAVSAGRVAKYFAGCPDNAFQVALAGTSYSFLQRIGAIVKYCFLILLFLLLPADLLLVRLAVLSADCSEFVIGCGRRHLFRFAVAVPLWFRFVDSVVRFLYGSDLLFLADVLLFCWFDVFSRSSAVLLVICCFAVLLLPLICCFHWPAVPVSLLLILSCF